MRVKEAVTKVNMRTVREAGEEKKREFSPRSQAPTRTSLRSATRSGPSAARICCQKYQLELPAEGYLFSAEI